jgi:putative membrane protein
VERTLLAHERTLMAWIRTATSLISFGFTIYKFFQFLREEGRIAPSERLLGSREFAMLMILTGLVALGLATVQHRASVQQLRAHTPNAPYSLSTAIAFVVGALGFVGLIAVVFRQ